MELMNEMYKAREAGAAGTPEWTESLDIYLRMLAPICPHVSEELWQRLGKRYSIHNQEWPRVDEAAAAEDEITIAIQINGKLRDRVQVPAGSDDAAIQAAALAAPGVQKYLEGKQPKKIIVAGGKLVNIVA
jgi:leucyl-tRNA synthetase